MSWRYNLHPPLLGRELLHGNHAPRPVEERVSEHALGLHEGYTFTRRPVTLVHAESYERIDEAIAAERRIKGWSRAKKEAYIRGDFEALAALSRRRSKSES